MPQLPGLFPQPKRKYEGPLSALPDVPLEETNPWLARARDFLGNFTGLGTDRGLLAPEEQQTTAGLLGDAAGQFNPEKMLVGPLVGMTRFLKGVPTAEGIVRVPDVARRVSETKNRLGQLYMAGINAGASPEDIQKTLQIAQRYPRTLAHTSEIESRFISPGTAGTVNTNITKRPKMILSDDLGTLEAGDTLQPRLADPQYPLANTFAHELQHVGQNVGDSKVGNRYDEMNNMMGYLDNPYEVAARQGSIRRVYGGGLTKPRNKRN